MAMGCEDGCCAAPMGGQQSLASHRADGPGVTYDARSGKVIDARPRQYAVTAASDFKKLTDDIYKNKTCVTKTVILPPGVEMNDPRLAQGVVVKERVYTLEAGEDIAWPDECPFESDIDGRLLKKLANTHYAVYPDDRFEQASCGFCDHHNSIHPKQQSDGALNAMLPEALRLKSQSRSSSLHQKVDVSPSTHVETFSEGSSTTAATKLGK